MDIKKYEGYFHDGSLDKILYSGNEVQLLMTSAEMDEEDIVDDAILSSDDRIQGILHIKGIKNITRNKDPYQGVLKMEYDSGEILDLEIFDHYVVLGIEWTNYPPKTRATDYSLFKIEAEKIWWENIPDLL